MKAIAVIPGKPDSIHLREAPEALARRSPRRPRRARPRPARGSRRHGQGDQRGRVRRAAGRPRLPDPRPRELRPRRGGRARREELAPGDYVVASVRRPGSSLYDAIGLQDMTTDDSYFERGINLLHGYLAEYYVDAAEFLVKIPQRLKAVGVLMEPTSVAEKAIGQAYEIQRRLRVWRPRKAAVLGTGTLGLLASMILKLRGLEVTAFGLKEAPAPQLGPARGDRRALRLDEDDEPPAGSRGARALRPHPRGHRVLAARVRGDGGAREERRSRDGLASRAATGRSKSRPTGSTRASSSATRSPSAASTRAARTSSRASATSRRPSSRIPGWLEKLLTHPVRGLENYRELLGHLTAGNGVIKAYCEVAPLVVNLDAAVEAVLAARRRVRRHGARPSSPSAASTRRGRATSPSGSPPGSRRRGFASR